MTAVSAPRPGWELLAGQVNQRRYEALRAYLYEGLSLQQAADAAGYTRSALASLVRDLRAGKVTVFAPPGVPGRKGAPKKDAARGRVIELRREGLSVYEISMRVTREGTPLGRSAVSDILREEGFGRLVRGAAPEASTSPSTSGRDTRLPAASVIDFGSVPPRAHTAMAGLLLTVPDLVALDLPGLADKAGYPGTRVIPAVSWLLSLLALKLTATRRVSHVDDLLADPAPALLAGLAVLPKKTALTDYSYRLSHDHQLRFLAALDKQMIGSGLAAADEAIFDLDFHAVMHWGHDRTPVPPPSPAGPRPRSARFCPRQWAPREFGYPIHAVSVFPPLSPGAGNSCPTTSDSRSYTSCSSDRTRTPRASAYPLPARPYWPSPSPRRPAPPTLGVSNGFPGGFSWPMQPLPNDPVDQTNQPRMTRPLRSPAITAGSPLLQPCRRRPPPRVLSASRVMPLERAPSRYQPRHQHPGHGSSIGVRLPTFRAEAAGRVHVASMPDTTWPVGGHPPGSSREHKNPTGLIRS